MFIKIIDSGKALAEQNMMTDQSLLDSLDCFSKPLLHFYDWLYPSATYGYFCQPSRLLCEAGAKKHHLNLARRPTGGGIIFHSFDFTFSFLLPSSHPQFSLNTLDNYQLVNQIITQALKAFLKEDLSLALLVKELPHENNKQKRNFCMAMPTVYDVIFKEKKIAGGAQRRTKAGFLHQASIALAHPPERFLEEVLLQKDIVDSMKNCTFPLIADVANKQAMNAIKEEVRQSIIKSFDDSIFN